MLDHVHAGLADRDVIPCVCNKTVVFVHGDYQLWRLGELSRPETTIGGIRRWSSLLRLSVIVYFRNIECIEDVSL